LVSLSDYIMPTAIPSPLPSESDLSEAVVVETYVYGKRVGLIDEIWNFDDFVTKNAWKWYGSGARDNPDYTEVDRRQAGNSR
jgi:hypothetical protein